MSSLVIDASVTMTWFWREQGSPMTAAALDAAGAGFMIVPVVWSFEVTNVLATAQRKGTVAPARIREFIALLERVPTQVDSPATSRVFGDVLALAHAHKLSSYDACYLELALRLGLQLATLDAELEGAARATGAVLFEA